jgi:peptide-methionine (S)-S-oxide reductase
MEKATFGAGCFWGVEAAFRQIKGVASTAVGYAGGRMPNPTYQDVCYRDTGHAEVVQVEYDPAQVSYDDLLAVFWENHDPTTLNRQGPDEGPQYRSVIFYRSAAQRRAALEAIRQVNAAHVWPGPIVTAMAPFTTFWRAEDYHLDYYNHHPYQPYCQYVIAPEIAKFRTEYRSLLKQ